mgnify:CR=1 FL=1
MIPTYNESENVRIIYGRVRAALPKAEILFVDDNSPDGTREIIISLQKNFKNLYLINRDKKLGLDTAHKLAYNYAILNKYDFLITMDADLSHDPKEIPLIIKLLDQYEFVLGSRYVHGAK